MSQQSKTQNKPLNKSLTLGIFGFGTVGQGLWKALQQSNGLQANVKKICIRDPYKTRSLPDHHFTTDRRQLLDDPEINVIVELIDDPEQAWEIVSEALRKGKAVVTANKKLIADHYAELRELQEKHGAPLLYEAACCGSIPVIRNLEEYFDNDLLRGVGGIFNGSTNFILDQIFEAGLTFRKALQTAQRKGFAESDPTLDVEGFDPCYKLAILVAHAFGVWVEPAEILRVGIRNVGAPELRYAREKGYRLKLVARAEVREGKLHAAVLPRFVRESEALYHVGGAYNAVLLEGAFSDVQILQGKGAGSLPTGAAVLSDISALRYDYRYAYRKSDTSGADLSLQDACIDVYFRYFDPAVLSAIRFEKVFESYRGEDHRFCVARVRQSELQRFFRKFSGSQVFVAEVPDSRFEAVDAELEVATPELAFV
ncbi:MAG: homoserine dehydrogenase [Bacteroidota bacterium]